MAGILKTAVEQKKAFRRQFTFVDDISPLIVKAPLLPLSHNTEINLGSHKAWSLPEVVKTITEVVASRAISVGPIVDTYPPLRRPYRPISHSKQYRIFGNQQKSRETDLVLHIQKLLDYVKFSQPVCAPWIAKAEADAQSARRAILAAAAASMKDIPAEFSNSNKVAVLVETRMTNLFVPVVNAFLINLSPSWRIQIFHTQAMRDEILSSHLASFISSGKIVLTLLTASPTSKNAFSAMITSTRFWDQVIGEKVLIFQLDSILCSRSRWKVDDFLEWDYIGAPWGHYHTTGPGFLPPKGGNGGLSLRSKSWCVKTIQLHPWDGLPEDVYFSRYIDKLGGRVADRSTAARFSVEGLYTIGAAGVHQPWLAGPGIGIRRNSFVNEFESFCPEYKMIGRYGLT